MADLFSNVPIPQPLNPLQKPDASSNTLVQQLANAKQRQFEMFKMGENAKRDDLNTLLEYDAYKLGQSFGSLWNLQKDRVKDQIINGNLSPAQSKSLVLSLINDYQKYYNIHAKPFNETWDMHMKLATNPSLLDQYNENLPIGQVYTPMEVGELADIKNQQLNQRFDILEGEPIFLEDGSVQVYDPIADAYVKPEMLTGIGTYDNLFAQQVTNQDIGDLYDWGSSQQAKEVVNVGGRWNEEAANKYFNSHVNLENREGQIHRSQLLASYENALEDSESDPFFTDAQRQVFITKDPESPAYESVWGSGGLAGDVFRRAEEMELWKDATYFEPNTIASDAARRNQRRADRELQDGLITSGQLEPSAPILNAPATARYIRKVGDSTTISLETNDGFVSVIPEYHYINEKGRHVLKYSTTGTNLTPAVMNQVAAQGGAGMTTLTSGEVELTGANYDAVDRYIMAKFGGARLQDLVPGELPKPNPDTQVGSGYVLNDMLGEIPENQELETPGLSITASNEAKSKVADYQQYYLGDKDANTGKIQDKLRSAFNVNQSDIDWMMSQPEFYQRLADAGYRAGGGGTGISRALDAVGGAFGLTPGFAKEQDAYVSMAVDVAYNYLKENGRINE
jgi:hypothetical protein